MSWCNMLRNCSKRARVSDVTPETCGIGGVGSDLATEMMNTREELLKDLRTGLPILGQVLQSSWWEWSSGSTLFFWRWNGREQISAARDGMRFFVHGPLPRSRHMKPLKLTDLQTKLVLEKIDGMIRRSYLSAGFVKSSLHFFAVPKGQTDIRIIRWDVMRFE